MFCNIGIYALLKVSVSATSDFIFSSPSKNACAENFFPLWDSCASIGPRAEDDVVHPPVLFADIATPGTYDTWTIVVRTDGEASINRAFNYVEYVIAVEDAVTNEAELDTFFDAIQVAP